MVWQVGSRILVVLAVVDGIFDQLHFLMQVKYVYLISLVGACVVFSLYGVLLVKWT